MPVPTRLRLGQTAGKTILATDPITYDQVMIAFADNTFCIIGVDYDQGFPSLADLEFQLEKHAPSIIATGLMTAQEVDDVVAARQAERENAKETREYETYLRLKEKYEPGA